MYLCSALLVSSSVCVWLVGWPAERTPTDVIAARFSIATPPHTNDADNRGDATTHRDTEKQITDRQAVQDDSGRRPWIRSSPAQPIAARMRIAWPPLWLMVVVEREQGMRTQSMATSCTTRPHRAISALSGRLNSHRIGRRPPGAARLLRCQSSRAHDRESLLLLASVQQLALGSRHSTHPTPSHLSPHSSSACVSH